MAEWALVFVTLLSFAVAIAAFCHGRWTYAIETKTAAACVAEALEQFKARQGRALILTTADPRQCEGRDLGILDWEFHIRVPFMQLEQWESNMTVFSRQIAGADKPEEEFLNSTKRANKLELAQIIWRQLFELETLRRMLVEAGGVSLTAAQQTPEYRLFERSLYRLYFYDKVQELLLDAKVHAYGHIVGRKVRRRWSPCDECRACLSSPAVTATTRRDRMRPACRRALHRAEELRREGAIVTSTGDLVLEFNPCDFYRNRPNSGQGRLTATPSSAWPAGPAAPGLPG